jgi:cytochrome c oxidase assembly factor CtaG/putative copper export protein
LIPLLIEFLPLLSGFVVIGYLFSKTFIYSEIDGKSLTQKKIDKIARVFSLIWPISSLILIFSTLNEIIGVIFDSATLRSFLTQTSLGRTLFIQLAASLLVLLFLPRTKRTGGYLALLALALIGFTAPGFESHSGDAGLHALAIGSIIFHLSAIALWVGSVIGIYFLDEKERYDVIGRFGKIALWLSIIVMVSGGFNAWTRMNFLDAFSSNYAGVLSLKLALIASLIVIAAALRRRLTAQGNIRTLLRVEIALLVTISFIGTLLSRTAPPIRGDEVSADNLRSLALTGMVFPNEPNFWQLVFKYEADGLILGALVIVTALYIAGVLRLARRGVKWPIGRTLSFALGITAIDYATSGGLGVYSYFSFSYHMSAHMVLGMIAPIGIVLGAPITLALRALPAGRSREERGVRGLLVAILSSRIVAIFSHPVVALAIFDGSLFAIYSTSLFDFLMGSHLGHLLMTAHFLLAGILFFHVIIGIDPTPRKYPYLMKIVVLLAAMSIHAFFSISLLSASTLLGAEYYQNLATPWVFDLLADQRVGASVGWAMGEIPILLALIATFIQWMRSDDKEAARIDRQSARAKARGEKDDLDLYNDYLRELANRDKRVD